MRAPMLTAVLAVALALAGCGDSRPPSGRAFGTIEEATGSYRGIHIGMRSETVTVLLGAPLPRHDNPYVDPRALPPFLPADTPADFVYPDLDISFLHDRVASMTVFGQGAATTRGVAVGSPLAEVSALYPGATCRSARGGNQPIYAGCEVPVALHRYLYFGGNPVALIVVSRYPPIPPSSLSGE